MTTYDAPHGVDGTRISTGPTVWGDACLSFEPTTSYYGAFDGTTVETEVTITSTTTFRGRTAHHDKKISSTTVVSPPALRVSAGAIYSYTTRSLGPFVFDAPYPS